MRFRVVLRSWLFFCVGRRAGHVRVFGYGLAWKDTRSYRLLWSERERIFWQVRIGPWLLTPLPRGERGFKR